MPRHSKQNWKKQGQRLRSSNLQLYSQKAPTTVGAFSLRAHRFCFECLGVAGVLTKNSPGDCFWFDAPRPARQHLADSCATTNMLSDCGDALKAKLEEAGAKVTLK